MIWSAIFKCLKTLTKSSAGAGKLFQAISHRKGSRIVVFVGSSFAIAHLHEEDFMRDWKSQ